MAPAAGSSSGFGSSSTAPVVEMEAEAEAAAAPPYAGADEDPKHWLEERASSYAGQGDIQGWHGNCA